MRVDVAELAGGRGDAVLRKMPEAPLDLADGRTIASGIHLAQDAFVVFVDIVDEDGRRLMQAPESRQQGIVVVVVELMIGVHRRRQDMIEDLPDGEEIVVLEDRLQRPAAAAQPVVRGLEDGDGEGQQPHRSPVAFAVAQVAVVAGRYDAGKAAGLLDQGSVRQDVGIFFLDRQPLCLEKKCLPEALGRDDDRGALVVRLEERSYFRIGMEQIGTKAEYVFGIHLARVDDPRLHRCHH